MTIAQYFFNVKQRLLIDPIVTHFQIKRERSKSLDGYLRVRLTLNDGSWLEFGEYVQLSATGQILVMTYSYHWADANNQLIRRWDNTPHFPKLSNFPHHIHDGQTGQVIAGKATNIVEVLDEIAQRLRP